MDNLRNLNKYRALRKKQWLEKHRFQMNSFLSDYINQHFDVPFEDLSEYYQLQHKDDHQETWDYVDLRDLIHTAMEEHFCENLYKELKNQLWFASRLISKEEAIEYCLSLYISGTVHSSSSF